MIKFVFLITNPPNELLNQPRSRPYTSATVEVDDKEAVIDDDEIQD